MSCLSQGSCWSVLSALVIVLSGPLTADAGQGWYLLAPPINPASGGTRLTVEGDAPLSRWSQSGAYDTAAACEVDRLTMTKVLRVQAADETTKDRSNQKLMYEAHLQSRCITSDDPRLKP